MKLLSKCKINDQGVSVNDVLIESYTPTSDDWKKELYVKLESEYPKFYKMDALAKMAYLAFKLIEKEVDFSTFKDDEIALLFANNSSSQTTDNKYKETYLEKGSPSPSLFVYTLPNILTGELAILNKWYGENIFFIQENFDPEFYMEQINIYFRKGAKACLAGWIESGINGEECILFFVENDGSDLSIEELLNK